MDPIRLISVDRNTLPGEIAWWFADLKHVEDLASAIGASTDLSYRASAIYVACQWYYEQQKSIPAPLVEALRRVLEVDSQPGAVDQPDDAESIAERCRAIVGWWRQDADDRNLDRERRRRSPSSIPVALRRSMYSLVWNFANRDVPPAGEVLYALAHLLGLISPVNGRVLPAAKLLKLIGLPSNVDKLAPFLRAARLDGEALVPATSGADPFSAYRTADEVVATRLATNTWALSERGLSQLVGVTRSTIRSWRSMPEYRRLARSKATWPDLHKTAWAHWNRPR